MLLTWPDLREERNSSMPLLRVPPRLEAAMDWIPRLVCCWAVTDGPNWKRAPPPVVWKLLIAEVASAGLTKRALTPVSEEMLLTAAARLPRLAPETTVISATPLAPAIFRVVVERTVPLPAGLAA